MRALRVVLVLLLALTHARPSAAQASSPAPPPISELNRQLLLVRSPSWFAASGTLERYQRDAAGHWTLVGPGTAVSLGRHGMGWGRGLHARPKTGPFKLEGDGRSPAGAFALSTAFGVADALPAGSHGFPFLSARASTYCVEDLRSKYYNRIIDANDIARTGWERWSELRRADGLFDWGVVVRQNEPDIQKSAGSCVFLHVWRGPHNPTAGCTAMPREAIEGVVRWLDPLARPVLVQLPEPMFQTLRALWDLP